jgi:hypothetical protein
VSPRWETVVRIAEALEVPVEDLAAGEDTRRPGRSPAPIRPEGLAMMKGPPDFHPQRRMFLQEEEEPEEMQTLHTQTARLADTHEQRARE